VKKPRPGRAQPATDHQRPITAYDVADLAGVSQSAVSRAFTPGASVSPKTRAKIMAAARKLNYRPNLIARSLITKRSNLVGVVVPPLENQFYPTILETLSAAFARHGRKILLFTSRGASSVEPILEDVLSSRVDALVMVAASVTSRFADECQKIGLPIVLLNRKTESKLISSVTGANRKGARAIADFLMAGRHSRFAYIAGLEASSTNRDREEAFTERLKANDKVLTYRVAGDYSTEGAIRAARELLSQKRPPDAIFCANDHMALVAISVARAEFGMEVGQSLSIVGFDDSELSRWPIFGLTTYAQPVEQMADRVTQIVQSQLDGESEQVAEVEIEGDLLVRTSARVPRHGVSGPPHRLVWKPSKGA
jgi:DNA-binding LacI/PurR family transcriptional regulator